MDEDRERERRGRKKEYDRLRRLANLESERARGRAYDAAHPDRGRNRQKYSDRKRASDAARRLANPEAYRERNRAYYRFHKEKAKARVAAWRTQNADRVRKREQHRRSKALATTGSRQNYFIENPTAGWIKIGVSNDAQYRLRRLRRFAGELVLLAAIPGDDRTETLLHQRFAPFKRANSECFDRNPGLQAMIAEINSGKVTHAAQLFAQP